MIRESRLSFHIRCPFGERRLGLSAIPRRVDVQQEPFTMNKYSYTPTANFDNAPPGKPGKPDLDIGLIRCDEKAAAARKILEKLQFGDPEDENTCFVRRFWRDTTTSSSNPIFPSLLSAQLAGLAERTASLEATLEEVFDGLRIRLHRRLSESETSRNQEEGEENLAAIEGRAETVGELESARPAIMSAATGDDDNEHPEEDSLAHSVPYYDAWDQETSNMNNSLDDIWDDLEGATNSGHSSRARVNVMERRAAASMRVRNRPTLPRNTVSIGTGPDEDNEIDGVELDDTTDEDDDGDLSTYFRYRARNDSRSNVYRTFSEESNTDFLRDVGFLEEVGQEIFDMFTISEAETSVPSTPSNDTNLTGENDSGTMTSSEIPEPLYPRNDGQCARYRSQNDEGNLMDAESATLVQRATSEDSDSEVDDDDVHIPQIPLVDTTPFLEICPRRDDECSAMVYLDEHYMNFPFVRNPANHNEE